MKLLESILPLYAVTNRNGAGDELFDRQVEAALRGGATLVQLREKNCAEEELIARAMRVKAICRQYGVPLIVNDSVNAALKSGADGVHVGIADEEVAKIRREVGENFIIGATAKTVEQARAAESAGADYLGVGAVFPSPTKQNAIRISLEELKTICHSVKIPVAAIGGIDLGNVGQLRKSGIHGIAVVSGIFSAEDIEDAAKKMRDEIDKILEYSHGKESI